MQNQYPRGNNDLERLFNFHKNTTKYTYDDQSSKFALSHEKINIKPETNHHDDYMLGLWNLFDKVYFKDIGEEQLSILNYIAHSKEEILNKLQYEEMENRNKFEDFVKEIYSQEFLNAKRQRLQYDSWMEEIYTQWSHQNDIKGQQVSSKEIKQMQDKLREIQFNNLTIVHGIYQKIHKQANQANALIPEHEGLGPIDELTPILNASKAEIQRSQIVQYLKYQINHLQQKQIAESISKVKSKKIHNNANFYQVTFEQAMCLGCLLMSEQQLADLNKLRDTSLFQFYAVGWKSKFNYVCQNYYGFQMLATRNNKQEIKANSFNMFPQLSSSNQGGLSGSANDAFGELQSCHECKLLYNKNILTKCSYGSSKHKHSIGTFHDPYLYMMLRNQQKSNSILETVVREGWSIHNPFREYCLKNGEYSCGRYYCRMCRKKEEGKECKFCIQICMCSRCLRSNTINKLITIFIMLGGDMNFLRHQSYFAMIQRRKEGNAEKPLHVVSPTLSEKTLASFKFQLEQLRILAHMVMEREGLKEEQFLNEQQIFMQRLNGNE